MALHLARLKTRKAELLEKEQELDEQCAKVRQCLKNITEDPVNDQYPHLVCCRRGRGRGENIMEDPVNDQYQGGRGKITEDPVNDQYPHIVCCLRGDIAKGGGGGE